MAGIFPIPSSRISDLFIRTRLQSQIQADQQDLFRTQSQVSTGRRFFLPSEDAPAAQRAISLQRLLERKEQVQQNLSTNQSFLSATDAALNSVAGLLADVRGSALSVADTTSSSVQRQAVAVEVERAIQQLVDTGNQQFRGRFLFAGTRTNERPFDFFGESVVYKGNEGELRSFSDIDVLFETSINGNEVFGAISGPVRGTADLDPILTAETRLADLRGGAGIGKGSISISDGTQVSIVDIGSAETIGDVARLIETNPPAGRTVTVNITSTGLEVAIDAAGGGNLTITEVGGGTTAAELGIREETGALTAPVIGDDLNPRLRLTTQLDDLLGGGAAFDKDSGIRIENGGQTFDISFATAETVEDLLNIINGAGAGALAELNAAGDGINVRSRLSGADFSIGENGGTTATDLGIRSFTAETRLEDLRFGLGVQIADGTDFTVVRNDGVAIEIDLSGATTIGDVLDRINNHPDNTGAAVTARLAEFGNGIELVDDDPTGNDPLGNPNRLKVIADERSLAAVHLGLVPEGATESNGASGGNVAADVALLTNPNADINFFAASGGTAFNGTTVEFVNNTASGDQAFASYNPGTQTLTLDVDFSATRAITVVDAVITQVGNLFGASLNTDNGPNDGTGLIDPADAGVVATLDGGTPEVLTGDDVNPTETHGVFNSLLRLQRALDGDDILEISRSLEALDEDIRRVTFARAEVGARQQGLDVLGDRLGTEVIELRSALSEEIDVDLAEAISNLTARQFAFEASLRSSASILQLTLLNFL